MCDGFLGDGEFFKPDDWSRNWALGGPCIVLSKSASNSEYAISFEALVAYLMVITKDLLLVFFVLEDTLGIAFDRNGKPGIDELLGSGGC